MKTVGIITYHRHYNYGTMLQAYALQQAIDNLGLSAEIIDFYQPNELVGTKLALTRLKRLGYYFAHVGTYTKRFCDKVVLRSMIPQIKRKEALFDNFYDEHIKLSSQKYSNTLELIDDPPRYDIYMVGSDQTWNPYVGRNPDAFYLTFVPRGSRRVSYAPSVSVSNMTSEQRIRSRCLLTNVDELSCREKEGAELLKEITGRRVEKVLDPVFLLSAKQWNEVSANVSHPSKYILQYMIGDRVEHRRYVQRISKYMGLPIVSVPCVPMDMNARNTEKCWVGPDGFISLIRDAELICTDSFHGTAFSLLFQKPVYSFCKYDDDEQLSGNSRLRDVYMEFGIDNRIIKSFDQLPDKDDIRIDYNKVQFLREKALNQSYEYLRRILI